MVEFEIKHITLPELPNLFMNKQSSEICSCNQSLRKNIEKSKILLFIKEVLNKILNKTSLGESIQCIYQKI